MKQTFIHLRNKVDPKTIRNEKRDGRDLIIVPSATLPDDVVMNRVRYPADVIAANFATLDRSPAPLGHPQKADGSFISASDPEAIIKNFIGAWNENPVRRDGRVFVDKVIDVEQAKLTDNGRRVLAAIEKGESIHTSTGLLANTTALTNDADADEVVDSFLIDHDAILLDEEGAATPKQGVGMLVNKMIVAGVGPVPVINSSMEEEADRHLDYAVDEVLRAVERKAKIPMRERLKKSLLSLLGAGEAGATEDVIIENEEAGMAVTDEAFAALSEKLDSMDERWGAKIEEMDKRLTERLDAIDSRENEAEEKELNELREEVVENELLDEETAKTASKQVLNALLKRAAPKRAAPVHGAYRANRSQTAGDYEFPSEKDA